MSGGQQQRVAIARSLAGSPQLLIGDEPAGQLGYETGRQIVRLLRTVVRCEGITALVAPTASPPGGSVRRPTAHEE